MGGTYVADKVHFEDGAVVLESFSDHHGPKIGAADANIHNIGEALACEAENVKVSISGLECQHTCKL